MAKEHLVPPGVFNLICGPRRTTWRVAVRPAYRGDRAVRRKAAHRGAPSPRTQHPLHKARLLSPRGPAGLVPTALIRGVAATLVTGDSAPSAEDPAASLQRSPRAGCAPPAALPAADARLQQMGTGLGVSPVPKPCDRPAADSGSWPDTAQRRSCWLELVRLPTQAQPRRSPVEGRTLSSPSVSQPLGRHLLTPQASLREGGPSQVF